MTREEYIDFANALKNNYTIDFDKLPEFCDMAISALSAEPCREADDYENEITDLHNRLDIAEYDKERYKEEITILEAKNKEELTNEKAIAFLQDNGWLVEHDRIMTSGMENKGEWIPVSEGLPENIKPVIVTWKNTDPKSYYQYIVGKHFIGTAHYKGGKWFWYSSVTEDLLAEYGKCDSEEFDEAIEVIAWMPLPEPYKKGGE